jgi:hypothetical protein
LHGIQLPRQRIRLPKIEYELSVFLYAARLLLLALRVRPKVILVASGVTDWGYLAVLRLSGAKIVPILHNALWPEGFRPKPGLRQRAYRFVWQRSVCLTLAVSPACARQVRSVAGPVPVTVFKPSFPAASFVDAIRSLSDSHDGGAYSRLVDKAAALRSCILDDSTSLLEVLRATRKSILP